MSTQPWISIARSKKDSTLWASDLPFSEVSPRGSDIKPSLITLVGRRRKAQLLANMLNKDSTDELTAAHGQVRLIYDSKSGRGDAPTIFADCELQFTSGNTVNFSPDSCTRRPIQWLQTDHNISNLPNIFISDILTPLSNVVCYFASDFHGIPGVSALLAYQATQQQAHMLPRSAYAHILVVVDTSSEFFDPFLAQQKLHTSIKENLAKYEQYVDPDGLEDALKSKFQCSNHWPPKDLGRSCLLHCTSSTAFFPCKGDILGSQD